jgi:hypothetical protein
MILSFQTVAQAARQGARLLHDNHRCGAKSIVRREGAFFGTLSVK